MAGVDTADTPEKTNSAHGARRTTPFGLIYRTSGGDGDDTSRKLTRAIMAKDVDPNETDKRAEDERAWVNGKQTAGRGMPAQPAPPAQGGNAPVPAAGGVQQPAPAAGAAGITATADQAAGTVTLAGGPAVATQTITITYDLDGGGDQTASMQADPGFTADLVAKALAVRITAGGSATEAGGVITVTPDDGSIEKLEVAVT